MENVDLSHVVPNGTGSHSSAAKYSGRLIVQADWDKAVKEKDKKIWVGHEASDSSKPIYHDIKISYESQNPTFHCSDGSLCITANNRQMGVQVAETGEKSEFLAPINAFRNIHKQNIYSLDVTSGGLGVSSSSDGQLFIWSTKDGTLQRDLKGHIMDVNRCRFFPSGLIVLSGGLDMKVKIWSAETGECARDFIGHTQGVTDVDFVDAGKNVLSCSKDGSVKLWDSGSGSNLATINPDSGNIWTITLMCSVDEPPVSVNPLDSREIGTIGKRVLFGSETGRLFMHDLSSREEIVKYVCDSAVICCGQMSENVALCGTEQGTIYFYDLRDTHKPLLMRPDKRGKVLSVLRAHGGLYASFADGTVCHWPQGTARGPPRREMTGCDTQPVNDICNDGQHLYTCARDGIIRKYEVIQK